MSAYLVNHFTPYQAEHDQVVVCCSPWSKWPDLNGLMITAPLNVKKLSAFEVNAFASMLSTLQNTDGTLSPFWTDTQIKKYGVREKPQWTFTKLTGTDPSGISKGLLSFIKTYYK